MVLRHVSILKDHPQGICLYLVKVTELFKRFEEFFNPLPVQFKALLHGQKGCVFFSGHLNLRTAPETGLPSREKNHNN